jgi:NitT/TauT family transport system substrate-binding protein
MTFPRVTTLAAVCACAAITAGACSGDGERPLPGFDRVTAVVLPYLTMMPFHIAAEEGDFAEQRLDVEFRRLARNQDIMTALARGDVDVAAGMLTVNELSLAAAGARLRMVAAIGELSPESCPYLAVVARKEHRDSGALADPDRVRSLRFDVNRVLPLAYFLEGILEPLHLTIDDVDSVDVPPAAALEALRRGDIDVTIDSEPYVSLHLSNGGAVVWGALEQRFPRFAVSVLMFGPTLLDERPEVGERFATAMLKGIRRSALGKTPENQAIVVRETGLAPEVVARACWPTFSETARIDPEVFLGYQEWSVAHGLVDRVLAEDELFDHRFIDFANAELTR